MKIDPELKENIFRLIKPAVTVPGDIIELGVGQGANSIILGQWIFEKSQNKKYFGFDTFSGYTPEDISAAINPDGLLQNQDSGRWNLDPDHIKERIKKANLENNCLLVVGDIKKTVRDFCRQREADNNYKISILYIDCNAYLPAIIALNELKKFLTAGSLIIVDEHQIGGEFRALREFCADNALTIKYTGLKYPMGPSFITRIPSTWGISY